MKAMKNAFLVCTFLSSGIVSCSAAPEPYVSHKGSDNAAAGEDQSGDASPDTSDAEPSTPAQTSTVPTSSTPASTPAPVTPSPTPTPSTGNTAETAAAKKAAAEKEAISKVSAAFDGFRYEFPCDKDVGTSDQCDSKAAVSATKVVPEAPAGLGLADKYSVELRFRGVVEPMMYKDGKYLAEGSRFYTGGVANNGTYNIYSIEVSNPKQIYYLNAADAVGHLTDIVDYKAKIEVAPGATIKFIGNGQNGVEIANFKKLVVPDVLPTTAYNGQFLQLNVVGVTAVTP